jgi:hypothetical protein
MKSVRLWMVWVLEQMGLFFNGTGDIWFEVLTYVGSAIDGGLVILSKKEKLTFSQLLAIDYF